MLTTKIVSSQEKVFLDSSIYQYPTLERISALRGERVSVQFVYTYDSRVTGPISYPSRYDIVAEGELLAYATMREVASVPVTKAILIEDIDDNYLRTTPGLYPDLLRPIYYGGKATIMTGKTAAIWVEVSIPEDMKAGEYEISFSIDAAEYGTSKASVKIEIIDAVLPKEDIYFTQWFHADCLANYYNVDVWSEKHWEVVENFVHTARRNGINLLLTPVFTPPLDTAVGGERRTTQLVGVTKCANDYTFDFSLVDRWIDMCDRQGIEYLEISHLFTQWGAKHAPKIMATVDGEYKKIFGWDTEATGKEYTTFLRQFLTELLAHLKARGDDKRCFFHISDEPGLDHLENYKAAKAVVADILEGYTIIDALSKYDFYQTGVLAHPIPANNHIEPFLENNVPHLWTYYCVSQYQDVSNRYMSMPLWRTRSIGMQMYKYNIEGFLQWGYNFYNNQYSTNPINPYVDTSADFAFPSGDSFSVYPAEDGTALESTRILAHFEALQDIKAMKLCEKYYGHEAVVAAIEETFGKTLTFATCAKSGEMMLRIRERINEMIKSAISK